MDVNLCGGIDRIHTLGPAGTDSHCQAQSLGDSIELHPSFGRAIRAAIDRREHVVCPVGLIETLDGHQHCWVDYHFRHMPDLVVCRVWHGPTKPMAVVEGLSSNGLIAAHQSTREFLTRAPRSSGVRYTHSKMEARHMVIAEDVQYAICSNDDLPPNVRVLETFYPTMVWVLYKGK